MISELILKKAAAEAAQALRDSHPAPAECEHEFSPSFQRKMRRILRKAKHPVIYRLSQYAACFALVIALVGGAWLTVDTETRAAFFTWVKEQYETFVEYRSTGEAPQENTIPEYELTWLPDGFSSQEEQELDGCTYRIYSDDSGRRIIFFYMQGGDAASLFITSDYVEIRPVQIGDIHADFYQAGEETSSNALVWISEEDGLVFYIMANLSEDMMIKLAESVKKII